MHVGSKGKSQSVQQNLLMIFQWVLSLSFLLELLKVHDSNFHHCRFIIEGGKLIEPLFINKYRLYGLLKHQT